MSHSWSWILGVIVASLGCSGCASSLFGAKSPASNASVSTQSRADNLLTETRSSNGAHPEAVAASVAPRIPSSVDDSRKPTQHVAHSGFTTGGVEPTPTNPNPNRFSIATTPATPEQKTEVDLADLDRALNSPDSELAPQYQAYLRAQLSAIAGRESTGLPQDRLLPVRRSRDPLEQVQQAALQKLTDTVESSESLAANGNVLPRPAVPPLTEPRPHSATDSSPSEPPIRDARGHNSDVKTVALSIPTNDAVSGTATAVVKPEIRRGEWREHLSQTLETLERELARYTPSDREGERMATSARLLHLIANHRDQAVATMDKLSEDEREYWKHQLHALLVALDADDKHAGSRRAALALRELREAENHLANMSTLDVRNLAFCEEVKSFGNYTPVKSISFKPGQRVFLYVEIDNFSVHLDGDKYETKLQTEYNIVDASGGRISTKLEPVNEECRNRRHDYYITYTIDVPKDLRPGDYTLQLTIEDEVGQKSSEASIDFRVR